MPTLYAISEDLRAIESLLMELGGDVTDEKVNEAVTTWFAETDQQLDIKTENYCRFIRELEAKAEARKKEASRIAELAAVTANAAGRLKARLFWFMDEHSLTAIDTENFKVTIAGNGGMLPLTVDCEPDRLPEWARHTRYEANNTRIRQALDKDEKLSFASYGVRGKHLRIR